MKRGIHVDAHTYMSTAMGGFPSYQITKSTPSYCGVVAVIALALVAMAITFFGPHAIWMLSRGMCAHNVLMPFWNPYMKPHKSQNTLLGYV